MRRRFVSQHDGVEVLTAVTVKSTIYLDVPPSSPQMYPIFRVGECLPPAAYLASSSTMRI
jgi:hypothetical protein